MKEGQRIYFLNINLFKKWHEQRLAWDRYALSRKRRKAYNPSWLLRK